MTEESIIMGLLCLVVGSVYAATVVGRRLQIHGSPPVDPDLPSAGNRHTPAEPDVPSEEETRALADVIRNRMEAGLVPCRCSACCGTGLSVPGRARFALIHLDGNQTDAEMRCIIVHCNACGHVSFFRDEYRGGRTVEVPKFFATAPGKELLQ
jgi:hypothetical protein